MNLVVDGLRSAVLRDCHLAVSAGEIVTLRGASGSGKTLLLRAIADLDPHAGEVWLDGVARSGMSGPAWRRQVRFVAAESAWWADRVGAHFRAPDEAAAKAVELGLPGDCMDWQVARLSTGEKQRLGVLRAVEDHPKVLLLDEPTAALDAAAEKAVEALIQRLRADGAAVVLVTHSNAQAARLADRRYVIADGVLREDR
ncbi:MAG: ABC transporter ATP-binding protein [Hyphomicrobiales bacterium]